MSSVIGGYITRTILYSLLAFVMVEAMLIAWRVRRPAHTIKFRLLPLVLPPPVSTFTITLELLGLPALGPGGLVLFQSNKWLQITGNDTRLWWSLFAVIAAACGYLFVSHVLFPAWRHSCGIEKLVVMSPRVVGLYEPFVAKFASLGKSVQLRVCDDSQPGAYVRGLRTLVICISRSLLDLLDENEVDAVLAHEVAHVRNGHIRLSWLIFVLRGLMFYNPIAIFCFNRISLDMECLCDDEAVSTSGKRLAFCSALIKVHRALAGAQAQRERRWPRSLSRRLAAWEYQARWSVTLERVKRLLAEQPQPELRVANLKLALLTFTAISVMVLVE